jgi:hypothetical protein
MEALADQIAAQLHAVLDRRAAAGVIALDAQRGLAAGGPDEPVIVLTVEDVARLAAQVVHGREDAP